MKIRELNQSKSTPGAKPYETLFDTDTLTGSCTCRGWTTAKEGKPRDCTHVKKLRVKHGGVEVLPASGNPRRTGVSHPPPTGPFTAVSVNVGGAVVAAKRTYEPMLASAMTNGLTIDDYAGKPGWILEVKYNGERRITEVRRGIVVRSLSRSGKTDALPDHVKAAAAHLPDGVYDGELVNLNAAVQRSGHVRRGDMQADLTLVLFDVLEMMGESVVDLNCLQRRQVLTVAIEHVERALPLDKSILLSLATEEISREHVQAIWDAGGEGAILKRLSARYQPGYRSADWVKVVQKVAVPVTVIGFAVGDTGIKCGKMMVRDDAGREFNVKTKNNAMIREAQQGRNVGRRAVLAAREFMPETGAWLMPRFDHWAGEGE